MIKKIIPFLIIISGSLILLGAFLNLTVIIFNKGKMPVKTNLSLESYKNHFKYNNYSEVNLAYLSDRFQKTKNNKIIHYSIGDVLINIGVFMAIPLFFISLLYYIIIRIVP